MGVSGPQIHVKPRHVINSAVQSTVHLRKPEQFGCEKNGEGVIERVSGCIRFREVGNTGTEAGFDHVHVHDRGPEGAGTHAEDKGGRRA